MPSLRQQLDQAREHVAHARQRIEEQTALIERLRSDGHSTEAAEQLLAVYLDLMGKLALHREMLEREAEERTRRAN